MQVVLRPIFFAALICAVCFSCAKEEIDDALTVEEYVKLGVPDPQKKWSMAEISQAYAVFGQIKWDKPYLLPRKDNKKSGVLFDRMLSLGNLSFLYDPALDLNARAEHISDFLKVYDYWLDVYGNPVIGSYYNREQLFIGVFNLGVIDKMVRLAVEIEKSEEPTAAPLKYGVPDVKMNYITSLNVNLKTQSRSSDYAQRDLEVMADSIYTSVMRNIGWMESKHRSEVKSSLRGVLESTSSESIKEKYSALEQAL